MSVQDMALKLYPACGIHEKGVALGGPCSEGNRFVSSKKRKCIHTPVGDISRVEGREGCL